MIMNNQSKVISELFSFFLKWLSETPSITILWIIAIAGSFGQILYVTWFESQESTMFYFILFIVIIVIPTTTALIKEFKKKLQLKSPVKTKKPLIYAFIIAGLITGIVAIELVSFTIKFELFMTESTEYAEQLEGFEFWKNVGKVYSLYVVPPFLFGMSIWIKKLKIN